MHSETHCTEGNPTEGIKARLAQTHLFHTTSNLPLSSYALTLTKEQLELAMIADEDLDELRVEDSDDSEASDNPKAPPIRKASGLTGQAKAVSWQDRISEESESSSLEPSDSLASIKSKPAHKA